MDGSQHISLVKHLLGPFWQEFTINADNVLVPLWIFVLNVPQMHKKSALASNWIQIICICYNEHFIRRVQNENQELSIFKFEY